MLCCIVLYCIVLYCIVFCNLFDIICYNSGKALIHTKMKQFQGSHRAVHLLQKEPVPELSGWCSYCLYELLLELLVLLELSSTILKIHLSVVAEANVAGQSLGRMNK